MREHEDSLKAYETIVHAPIEQIKARLDRLERLRDEEEFNYIGKKIIHYAIVATSIDLAQAFENKKF